MVINKELRSIMWQPRPWTYLSVILFSSSGCVSSQLFKEATGDLRTCREQLDTLRESQLQCVMRRDDGARQSTAEAPTQSAIISKIDAPKLTELLQGYGAQVQPQGERLLFRVGRLNAWVQRFDEGKNLFFKSQFTGFRTTLQLTNDWNLRRRFSRTYLSPEGHAVIESDLLLAEGVTEETVKAWLRVCLKELVDFHKALTRFESSL